MFIRTYSRYDENFSYGEDTGGDYGMYSEDTGGDYCQCEDTGADDVTESYVTEKITYLDDLLHDVYVIV